MGLTAGLAAWLLAAARHVVMLGADHPAAAAIVTAAIATAVLMPRCRRLPMVGLGVLAATAGVVGPAVGLWSVQSVAVACGPLATTCGLPSSVPSPPPIVVVRIDHPHRIPATANGDRVVAIAQWRPGSSPSAPWLPLTPPTSSTAATASLADYTIAGMTILPPTLLLPIPHKITSTTGMLAAGMYIPTGTPPPPPSAPGVWEWSCPTAACSANINPPAIAPPAPLTTPLRGSWALALAALRITHQTSILPVTPALVRQDEQWIASHMVYSRAPTDVPAGWNPLAWVALHGHHGWCQVAAELLDRLVAIQTGSTPELVTGWLVPPAGIVTLDDAHAWSLIPTTDTSTGVTTWTQWDPTTLLHVPPAPPPPHIPAWQLAVLLATLLAVLAAVLRAHRHPARRAARAAHRVLHRRRRDDESWGDYVVAGGMDPAAAAELEAELWRPGHITSRARPSS
ncbi:MAG: hypothetical protein ACYCTL_12710 [Acidimicrobiales bacterium]